MPKFLKIVILTVLVVLTNLASLKVAKAQSDLHEFDFNKSIIYYYKNSIESLFEVEKNLFSYPKLENVCDFQTNLTLMKDPIEPIDIERKDKISFSKVESSYQKDTKLQKINISYPDPGFETKRNLVLNIANQYQIDWKILEAIWQVESGKSWNRLVISGDGARGPMQFLPSTFRKYAQDGDGDGDASIENSADALASAANLLKTNNLSSDTERAIFSYNHSTQYVSRVLAIAENI